MQSAPFLKCLCLGSVMSQCWVFEYSFYKFVLLLHILDRVESVSGLMCSMFCSGQFPVELFKFPVSACN